MLINPRRARKWKGDQSIDWPLAVNELDGVLAIFSDPEQPDLKMLHDQIAWFTGDNNAPALSTADKRGGSFPFTKLDLKLLNQTNPQGRAYHRPRSTSV